MGTGGRTLAALALTKARHVESWWIEREHGDRVAGPFTTRDDAQRARDWVEKALAPETFWVRSHPADQVGEPG